MPKLLATRTLEARHRTSNNQKYEYLDICILSTAGCYQQCVFKINA